MTVFIKAIELVSFQREREERSKDRGREGGGEEEGEEEGSMRF